MQIRDITFGSLRRRWVKSLFVAAALALGIATLVMVVSLTRAANAEIGNELDRFGANILVTPKSTILDLAYGGVDVGGVTVDAQRLLDGDIPRMRAIHHARRLSAVAPKIIGTIGEGGDRHVLIGVDMRQERRVKPWWQIRGTWPDRPDEILVGQELAARRSLSPGRRFTVAGRALTVAGVIGSTGALEDHAAVSPLEFAQRVLGRPGELSAVEVSALCQGCPIEEIVSQVAQAVPHGRVMAVRQAVAARERAVSHMSRFAAIVSVVVLAAAALVVAMTMLASVTERTREIGILRAVGFRQAHIVRIVLLEVAAVSLVGGLGGWLLGTAASIGLARAVADLSTPIPVDGVLAAGGIGLAVLLGVTAGVYPAIRAARLDPAQAFREV